MKRIILITVIIAIPVMLFGCKEKKSNQDIQSHIDQIKKTTTVNKTPAPTFKMADASKYQEQSKRSPFKPVVKKVQRNMPAGPLEEFTLSELRFIGTLQKNNQLFAVILTPDGRVYDVNIGDFMGRKAAKVVSISHETVEVKEAMASGGSHAKNKIIQLNLVSS